MVGLLIALVVIVVLLGLYLVATYNKLVHLRNAVKDQWAQIDVLLKRRADLIPNLVETIKGYAKHEKETLDEVTQARYKVMNATTSAEEIEANDGLSRALSKLLAITENYPDLKANTNFLSLQNDLKETEDKISFARQFYNDAVLTYKNKLEMFPSNIVASMFGFKAEAFFEVEGKDREVPQVKF